jgi:hypothetical protein
MGTSAKKKRQKKALAVAKSKAEALKTVPVSKPSRTHRGQNPTSVARNPKNRTKAQPLHETDDEDFIRDSPSKRTRSKQTASPADLPSLTFQKRLRKVPDKVQDEDSQRFLSDNDGYETRNGESASGSSDLNDAAQPNEGKRKRGGDDDAESDAGDDGGRSSGAEDGGGRSPAAEDGGDEETAREGDGGPAESTDGEDEDENDGAAVENEECASPKRKKDGQFVRVRITKAGEDKYWMLNTRKLVQNCAPAEEKSFYLYLPATPEESGSSLMIRDDLNLQEMAVSRGGNDAYALRRAQCFNYHHKKAKTQLNRSIVLAMTTDLFESQIAVNVMNGKKGPMGLHPCMSHLPDVAALAALFESDHLYNDEVLHAKWCAMFSSGALYGMDRKSPCTKLEDLVDVNYEAHARYEMVSRLSYQGFHHGYKDADLAERAKGFRVIRKKVRKDRLNNLKAAEAKRLVGVFSADAEESRQLALGSGGLADTTDDEDEF